MKKLHYIFMILMGIVSFFTLQSVNNNESGNKAWNTCAGVGCHNSSSATTVAAISLLDSITNLPVTEYEGGKTYKILMTGNNTSLSQFGFQLRETNNKGTFGNFPTNVGRQASGFITHSSRLNKTNLIFSVQMTWKAPAAGSGTVSFDGLINAVNGNGNNIGDAVSAVKTVSYNEKVVTTFALTCADASSIGTLTKNVAASGASFTLPYTGATTNSSYSAVNVSSTGVLGLTARLTAGTFPSASGNLTLSITGTPTSNGTASFLVNIAGKICTLTKTVSAGSSIISDESNPFQIHFQNNILSIEGDQANQIQSISAFDLNGRIVYNKEIHSQSNKLLINNINLNKGMYVFKIQKANGESFSKKLMIQ
jgi:hypothetical protein